MNVARRYGYIALHPVVHRDVRPVKSTSSSGRYRRCDVLNFGSDSCNSRHALWPSGEQLSHSNRNVVYFFEFLIVCPVYDEVAVGLPDTAFGHALLFGCGDADSILQNVNADSVSATSTMSKSFQGVLRVNPIDTPIIPNRQGFFSPRPTRERDLGTPILIHTTEPLHSINLQQEGRSVPQSPPTEEQSALPHPSSKAVPPPRGSRTYEVRGDTKRFST